MQFELRKRKKEYCASFRNEPKKTTRKKVAKNDVLAKRGVHVGRMRMWMGPILRNNCRLAKSFLRKFL